MFNASKENKRFSFGPAARYYFEGDPQKSEILERLSKLHSQQRDVENEPYFNDSITRLENAASRFYPGHSDALDFTLDIKCVVAIARGNFEASQIRKRLDESFDDDIREINERFE